MASRTRNRLGPYSRTLERGAIGRSIDGRSQEGRFLRAFERQLLDHIGGQSAASVAQRLLIARLARVALRLELFDVKIAAGTLTDHDARVYGALHNAFRLMLREVGLGATAAKPQSLGEYVAARAAERSPPPAAA